MRKHLSLNIEDMTMSDWQYYPIDATFNRLFKDLKGNGQKLPIEVVICESIFDDDFVEPGMKAFFTGMDFYDSNTLIVYLYFGDHEDYNKKFFKRTFYDKNGTSLHLATETGAYNPYYSVNVESKDLVSKYMKFF